MVERLSPAKSSVEITPGCHIFSTMFHEKKRANLVNQIGRDRKVVMIGILMVDFT
jgi:hypothetical protein